MSFLKPYPYDISQLAWPDPQSQVLINKGKSVSISFFRSNADQKKGFKFEFNTIIMDQEFYQFAQFSRIEVSI
jgi:hypothetical protein